MEVESTININYTLDDSANSPGQSASSGYADVSVKKIGGDVSAPKVIYQVEPEYTPDAKAAKFNGIVLVHLIVDANGVPRNVQVLRGVGMGLDENAVEAVKQDRFKPAMEDGVPVPVALNIEVNFKFF
jgi:protein TonB